MLRPNGDLLLGETNNDGPFVDIPDDIPDIIGFLLKFTLFGDIDTRFGKLFYLLHGKN